MVFAIMLAIRGNEPGPFDFRVCLSQKHIVWETGRGITIKALVAGPLAFPLLLLSVIINTAVIVLSRRVVLRRIIFTFFVIVDRLLWGVDA
jgi:hypothetical protein